MLVELLKFINVELTVEDNTTFFIMYKLPRLLQKYVESRNNTHDQLQIFGTFADDYFWSNYINELFGHVYSAGAVSDPCKYESVVTNYITKQILTRLNSIYKY